MLGAAKCLGTWSSGERGDWELLEFGTQRGNEICAFRTRGLVREAVPGERICLTAQLPELYPPASSSTLNCAGLDLYLSSL